MMEGPDAANARRRAAAAPAKEEGAAGTARDTTPPVLQTLRRVLRGIHWEYHKRQLDRLELVCNGDRQFQIARNQALRDINEGEEVMVKALYAIFGQQVPADVSPAKGDEKEKTR